MNKLFALVTNRSGLSTPPTAQKSALSRATAYSIPPYWMAADTAAKDRELGYIPPCASFATGDLYIDMPNRKN